MGKQRILIVDDTRLNIVVLSDILQNDYQIFVATSGEEGLSLAFEKKPDLILLDVVMPIMDGYEVCARLKSDAITQDIPIIFVTARGDEEDETKGLEIGAIDYVVKPVSPPIVRARVKNHLELKRYRDALQLLSSIDGLTGIANRRHFGEVYAKEWHRAEKTQSAISLILLDIDFFKKYNDHYGHVAGDECLRRVADLLKRMTTQSNQLVARYGGEEFIVVLPETNVEQAVKCAHEICTCIEALQIPHAKSSVSSFVTVSAGVASGQPCTEELTTRLVKKADAALYEAKRRTRNCVVAYPFQDADACWLV